VFDRDRGAWWTTVISKGGATPPIRGGAQAKEGVAPPLLVTRSGLSASRHTAPRLREDHERRADRRASTLRQCRLCRPRFTD
jgi:hypothetical protein